MDELILGSLEGRATRVEEERLRAWRAASGENEAEYQALAELWRLTGTVRQPWTGPVPSIDTLLQRAGTPSEVAATSRWSLGGAVAELKRRRVFRVAAAYAVAAWLAIQVASDSAPALGAPDWVVSTVVLLALLGFPVAVALAWAFDVSSAGIVRTPPTQPLIPSMAGRIAVAGAVLVLAVAGAAFVFDFGGGSSNAALGDAESHTVAVLPFAVRSGESLDHLGPGMAEVLSAELGEGGALTAVDANRVIGLLGTEGVFDPSYGREVAARLGAGHYVVGSVLEAGGRVRLTASLYDRSRGAHPVATRTVDGEIAGVLSLGQELAAALSAGLAEREQRAASVHLVWSGDDTGATGSVTADGQLLSFIDWMGGGNLAVRELATGENRLLTHKGDLSMDDAFAELSRFSPDGRRIAYSWFNDDNEYELRVMTVEDGQPRVLGGGATWQGPVAWRSDGAAVLTSIADNDGSYLVWISTADGTADTIASNVSFWGVTLSPDDRWIARTLPASDSVPHADVGVLSADGGESARVLSGPGNQLPLAWLPDGNGLLYWSDRDGVPSLWAVRMEGNQARGEPELVRADVSWPIPLGFANSDFYYGVMVTDRRVYSASVDLATGELLDPPTSAAHGSAGSTVSPAWSPDGDRLAYITEGLRFGFESTGLAIRDLSTGAVEEHALGLLNPRYLHWMPDGGSILLTGRRMNDHARVYRVDVATGRLDSLSVGLPDGFKGQTALSGDGRTLYLVEADRKGETRLVRHDVPSGAEAVLSTNATAGNVRSNQPVALSPGGRMLALAIPDRDRGRNELFLLPAEGGPRRLVHHTPLTEPIRSIQWGPGGEHLLFASGDQVWRLRLGDGEADPVYRMRAIGALRLAPDGRSLAFQAGANQAEVWRLEDPGAVLRDQ